MRVLLRTCWVTAVPLLVMACEPAPTSAPSAQVRAAAPAPEGSARRVGQDDAAKPPMAPGALAEFLFEGSVNGGLRGSVKDLESATMALVFGVTDALAKHPDDAEAAIAEVEAYIASVKPEAERLGAQHVALEIDGDRRSGWKRGVASRFRPQLKAYERVVARFELSANDEQILRFNAAMKSLAAPMHKN